MDVTIEKVQGTDAQGSEEYGQNSTKKSHTIQDHE